jgi:hypothetical protein
MVNDQIMATMEVILKMEASLVPELARDEGKRRAKERRSAGNSPVTTPHKRNRSQLFDQIRLDSTMVSEMEYLNMIPDMSRYMDVNESSFMRNMPNMSVLGGKPFQ